MMNEPGHDDPAGIARALSRDVSALSFAAPVEFVYNPLEYAWLNHREYLETYGTGPKRTLFVGMNPGPWGMAQTGVPFGEVSIVKDWLGLSSPIDKPACEHPARPVTGLDCPRSEVSGRRLWKLFSERSPSAEAFFADTMVLNYCPLLFLEESGRNRTPDKLPPGERERLFAPCDRALIRYLHYYRPSYVVGIGAFATGR
ncbi:MAG: single-stranded DNA-binding protein, partial [Spirochaetota bacterium]